MTVEEATRNQWRERIPRGSARLLTVAEIENMPSVDYVVEPYLVSGAVALMYGASGVGKSFVALDLAVSVASGIGWHGAPVLAGSVVYVAAEGIRSLGPRVAACRDVRGIDHADGLSRLRFYGGSVNLFASEHLAFLESIEDARPRLIIFDTLARCAVGADENSVKDTSKVVAALEQIADRSRATVLVLHHPGKDAARGVRGSSALFGAMDQVIKLSGKQNEHIILSSEKNRDGVDFPDLHLALRPQRDSLVLERRATQSDATEKARVSDPGSRAILNALCEAGPRGLTYSTLRASTDLAEQTFDRKRKSLVASGFIEKGPDNNSPYIVTGSGRAILAATTNELPQTSRGSSAAQLPPPPPSIGGGSG